MKKTKLRIKYQLQKLLLMTTCLLLALTSIAKNEKIKVFSEPLTNKGEINLWIFADKIIIPNGSKDLKQTLDEDFIADEASLAPTGGGKFTCANRDYKWGAVKLIDGYYGLVNDVAAGGKPLDYSTAYLYCVLNSDSKQDVNLILRSDDSSKNLCASTGHSGIHSPH